MKLLSDLIYDVGVHNGDDTAYYLSKGYRVVGVEADPTLITPLKERFATELATGQLTLLNVAMAPERQLALFWICEGYRLWNSFDREVASRMGRKCHSIEVECWPLRHIFEKHDVPHYLKLSLHGQEHFCLADIDAEIAPTYISLELPRDLTVAEGIMDRLLALGYHHFKIVDQTTQRQLVISPPTLKSQLRNMLGDHPTLLDACDSVISRCRSFFGARDARGSVDAPIERDTQADWVFPMGSSGPFGEDTHGGWRDHHDVRADWRAFFSGKTDLGPPGQLIWYDLHATR